MNDLQLRAHENDWRLFTKREADTAFLAFKRKILVRDNNTCQFCGFSAFSGMRILNRDGNYRNNRMSNLCTSCPFCAQCHFLEAIGKGDFGGGSLIYMPEMSQIELNALCHTLFSSMLLGNRHMNEAKGIYRDFKLRSQVVETELGEGMSNPALYGQLLIDSDMPGKQKHHFHEKLSHQLRVLPMYKRFVSLIQAWILEGTQQLQLVKMGDS